MSFTSIVKNEVSKLEMLSTENVSELSAILSNIGEINESVKIMTENASVARRIFNLLKQTYEINSKIIVRKGYNFNKNMLYILEFSKKQKEILTDLGIYESGKVLNTPKEYIISDVDEKRAYLRGVFLSIGSINDPKKSRYHLEFLVNTNEYALFLMNLMNEFRLNSKMLKRNNKYMIYVKEAEKIGDFLRILNCPNAVFYYEDIRIYRDHKNMTNRLNNCEQANIDKIIATANEQVNQIKSIELLGGLELLNEKERVVAEYRMKYPEVSLIELSEIISLETGHSITKSGLYHRFRKIRILADKLSNNITKNRN